MTSTKEGARKKLILLQSQLNDTASYHSADESRSVAAANAADVVIPGLRVDPRLEQSLDDSAMYFLHAHRQSRAHSDVVTSSSFTSNDKLNRDKSRRSFTASAYKGFKKRLSNQRQKSSSRDPSDQNDLLSNSQIDDQRRQQSDRSKHGSPELSSCTVEDLADFVETNPFLDNTPDKSASRLSVDAKSDTTSRTSEKTNGSHSRSSSPRSGKRSKEKGERTSSSANIQKVASSVFNAGLKAFNPTYKMRSAEFRKLFKDIPEPDKFVIDYSCALQKDILVQGRMYLSLNHVCFYANILKWETCFAINFKDVASVTKEKTAKVIPNAISVTTKTGERMFFTSFTHREKTYLIMFRLWQYSLLDEPLILNELYSWVQDGYNDSEEDRDLKNNNSVDWTPVDLPTPAQLLGVEEPAFLVGSGDEDLVLPDAVSLLSRSGNDSNLSAREDATSEQPELHLQDGNISESPDESSTVRNGQPQSSAPVAVRSSAGTPTRADAIPNEPCPPGMSPVLSNLPGNLSVPEGMDLRKRRGPDLMSSNKSAGQLAAPSARAVKSSRVSPAPLPSPSSAYESDTSDDNDKGCPCTSHHGKEILNAVYPVTVDNMFALLFTDNSFSRSLMKSRSITNIVIGEWRVDSKTGAKTRHLTYTVAITHSMGPKSSPVNEKQVVAKASRSRRQYSISCEVQNSNIPYADTFHVLNTFCLCRVGRSKCRLRVHGGAQYRKSCWGVVKAFIEKNVNSGLQEYCGDLDSRVKLESQRLTGLAGQGGDQDEESEAALSPEAGRRPSPPVRGSPDHDHRLRRLSRTRGLEQGAVAGSFLHREFEKWAKGFVAILMVMLALNGMLVYKLWGLPGLAPSMDTGSFFRHDPIDAALLELQVLQLQKSHLTKEDWIHLLKQERRLYKLHISKWNHIADSAVRRIEKIESSLNDLKNELRSAEAKYEPLVKSRLFEDDSEDHPSKAEAVS